MRFTSLCSERSGRRAYPATCSATARASASRSTSCTGPDAPGHSGPKVPADALETPNPVILVEVASPSTRKMDESVELDAYFRLPSVHHYLLVDPDGPPVVHYRRQAGAPPLRSAVHEGT